jgi:hypothetical protein
MNGQHETEEKLKQIVRKHAQRYLREPNVTSVGVGYRIKDGKSTGEMVIQFTVENKLSPEELRAENIPILPEKIVADDGTEVPVDVIERSYKPDVVVLGASAADFRRQRRTRLDPVRPGISICHRDGTAGTAGAVVYDIMTGDPYILSNWHVLQGPAGKVGEDIIQPGAFDGGTLNTGRVGKLVRSHLGLAGDCAICSIEGRGLEERILELDVTPRRIGRANLGDKVVKSGRTTGVTFGIVRRVGVVAKLNYESAGTVEIGGFEIGPNPEKLPADGEISSGGDSGSCWLIDSAENADVVVGLHFAGETDPDPGAEHAMACNIHSVFEKLGVSFERNIATQLERAYSLMGYSGRRPAAEAAREDVAVAAEAADPPALGPAQLEAIEELFDIEPEETVRRLRAAWDPEMTEEQLRVTLDTARALIERPERMMPVLSARAVLEALPGGLPDDFTFPGMDLAEIPINPDDHKFETVGDALGWVAFGAFPALFPAPKARFRNAQDFGSKFEYQLPEPSAQHPLEIAVFSDFGTGRYHSRYIAKQLKERALPVALHLGDVYYAGRQSEFAEFFEAPLMPILPKTELFMLNSNHEMFSGGRWYFDFMDRKRLQDANQRQEGSYFALLTERFVIAGIDTAYHRHGRFPKQDLQEWLRAVLSAGRAAGRTNILLSADHPYEYGEPDFTDLLVRDLSDVSMNGLVDLWFWGNTHYCGLFEPSVTARFTGCCVGHGGFPYTRKRKGEFSVAPVQFLESRARFPEATRVRQDVGNNGYCLMSLHQDGRITLRYLDWMSKLRCTAELGRADNASPLTVTSAVEHSA